MSGQGKEPSFAASDAEERGGGIFLHKRWPSSYRLREGGRGRVLAIIMLEEKKEESRPEGMGGMPIEPA